MNQLTALNAQNEHPLSPIFQDETSRVFMDLILAHKVEESRAKVENGIDINSLQSGGFSFLTFCLFLHDVPAFRLLLDLGANPNAICIEKNKMTPLMLAACVPETVFLQACISAGGNVNQLSDDGDSALILATACNNESGVRLLLMHGSDVNHQGAFMASALHEATQEGYQAIVDLLLNANANTKLRDENGKCANLRE
jgi:ankyrin repeat protein